MSTFDPVVDPEPGTSWRPTRKWIGALVAGALTIALHGILSGGFDTTEAGESLTLALALAASYFRTNAPTPGGVPVKEA